MKTSTKWLLSCLLLLLFLLHNDFWFWKTPQLVFGLPIGFLYHIGLLSRGNVADGCLRQSTKRLGRKMKLAVIFIYLRCGAGARCFEP